MTRHGIPTDLPAAVAATGDGVAPVGGPPAASSKARAQNQLSWYQAVLSRVECLSAN